MQVRRVFVPSSVIVMAALGLIAVTGCNKPKGPPTAEVTGVVTLNSTPVEGAIVLFAPAAGSEDARLASQATTDSGGKYRLQTHIGGGQYKPGIMPGKYDVTVTKLDLSTIKSTMAPPKNVLPAKYADAKTSPFKAEVVAGQENDFPLALKAD
jgi:hypothetical protein